MFGPCQSYVIVLRHGVVLNMLEIYSVLLGLYKGLFAVKSARPWQEGYLFLLGWPSNQVFFLVTTTDEGIELSVFIFY